MIRRQFLMITGALGLFACQKPTEKAPPPAPKRLPETGLDVPPDTVRVAIETSEGQIVLELDGKHAPQSTANFLHYVDTHKLDAGTFYRAIRAGDAGFIQFNSGDRTYPPIPHEPTNQTGLSHVDGAISTARYAIGTASNEFTICVGDMTYLDAAGAMTERRIWPFALGFFERVRVVVAWCTLRDDVRHFRTDRIVTLEATGVRYPRRKAVLLKDWRTARDSDAYTDKI